MTLGSTLFRRLRVVTAVIMALALLGLALFTHQSVSASLPANVASSPAIAGPFVVNHGLPSRYDGDLRDLPQTAPDAPGIHPLRYVPGQEPKGSAPQIDGWIDPVAQTQPGAGQMPTPIQNFSGISYSEYGTGYPPDTNGDVGPNHYVQTVNTAIGFYNKTTGDTLEMFLDTFFQGPPGSVCDNANAGDPVVFYDAAVDRWVVTDFAWNNFNTGPFYECIAVSQSGDPVGGGWYYYALQADTAPLGGYLNDYPKLGVWSDGWYMSANMFGSSFAVRVWALDREAMINGGPLTEVHFDTCMGGWCDSLLPANLRGAQPPAGAPNYFASVYAPNLFRIWEFDVDWDTPANSTFTGPTEVEIADFAIAPSIPQKNVSQLLDSLSFRLMMQLQYRNIDGEESLWATHSVASGGVVGMRWYQIGDPGGTPYVVQQSTFQPDSLYRWMGSIAADQDGNMAVGYSVSSSTLFPSIYYAGRLAGEVPGQLPQAETLLVAGTGAQTTYSRWGDYSTMTVDPVDDCTFWYTTEYYLTTGTNWQTRIGSFKFPSCGQPKGYLEGYVRDADTLQPIPDALVVAQGITQTLTIQADAMGYYTITLVGDSYDVTASSDLPGYPQPGAALNVQVNVGSVTQQDILLTPIPYLVDAPAVLVDDSGPLGNANGFPEPGEQGMLLWKGIENVGAAAAMTVTADLATSSSGVSIGAAAAAYPDIAAGEVQTNTTAYTFSLAESVVCGAELSFQHIISDSMAIYLDDFTLDASIPMPRTNAFFNDVEGGAAGWTTGGSQNTWAITTLQSHSPTHSWTDSPSGNYVNNTNSYLRTPAYNLSDKREVQISGWARYDLESGYDYVYLEYSLNGGTTWQISSPLIYFNGAQGWQAFTVAAPQLDHQSNVALRFRLVTDGGVVGDGIYLDDIALSYAPFECLYVPPVTPSAPNLIAPADGITVTNPVAFIWEDSALGDPSEGYTLTVDAATFVFTTPVTSTTLPDLAAGLHSWNVTAFNLAGSSPASETRMFTIPTTLPDLPAAPVLLSPADGTWASGETITFTWEASSTGGAPSGYIFVLDAAPVITFTTPVTSTPLSLAPGMHTWSVIAVNDAGQSAPSDTWTIWAPYRTYLPMVLR